MILTEHSSRLYFKSLSLFLNIFPFNIRCWTFDVRCSFFFSKPSTVSQLKNKLALMGGGNYFPKSSRAPTPQWAITLDASPKLVSSISIRSALTIFTEPAKDAGAKGHKMVICPSP